MKPVVLIGYSKIKTHSTFLHMKSKNVTVVSKSSSYLFEDTEKYTENDKIKQIKKQHKNFKL